MIFVASARSRRAARRASVAAACALVACGSAADAERAATSRAPTSHLSVRDAWARTADSGATGAVYFVIENAGAVSDTLVAVRSADAEESGLHVSMEHAGMMHMASLRTLPVPANDSVMFRPMGVHVMLTRLRHPLVEGHTTTLELDFVSGQSIAVRAGVRHP